MADFEYYLGYNLVMVVWTVDRCLPLISIKDWVELLIV